jgi:hypothetical protein
MVTQRIQYGSVHAGGVVGGAMLEPPRPLFFIGIHQPSDAWHVGRAMISINRLENRVSDFRVNDWLLDSGAFSRLDTGKGHLPVEEYARQILRWSQCGQLLASVSQDYMCEPFILAKTGMTVSEHQRLTTERYQQLRALVPANLEIMPVLQGYEPWEYVTHLQQYGDLILEGMWVGVGSVCKRNASPWQIISVLRGIKAVRPDLRLHGFGVKTTALMLDEIGEGFYSVDSMAWSFAARYLGRDRNSWREAVRFGEKISNQPVQHTMVL